jgi:two-component system NtrC family sensor kinase
MKNPLPFLLLLLIPLGSMAQKNPYWEVWLKKDGDSLRLLWDRPTNDTVQMGLARSLGIYYLEYDLDSSQLFFQQQLATAERLDQKLWEADALENLGYIFSHKKEYSRSLNVFLKAIDIAEDRQTEHGIWQVTRFSKMGDPHWARLVVLAFTRQDISRLYGFTGNYRDQFSNIFQALHIAEEVGDQANLANISMNIGGLFLGAHQLDSAFTYLQKAQAYSEASGFYRYNGILYAFLGSVYLNKGDKELAKRSFAHAIEESQLQNNRYAFTLASLGMANTMLQMGDRESSLQYAKNGLGSSYAPDLFANSHSTLASIYKLKGDIDSAFYYQGLAMQDKDSINNLEKIKQFENLGFDAQIRVQQLEKDKIENRSKLINYGLLAGLAILSAIAFIIYRNDRQKKKANKVLESTLADLKATQTQLIHSEKMASLGELTAGIAHEIQNPLNFVNNFSDLNQELVDELKAELAKGDVQEASAIADSIKENEGKINQHGKRAETIVRSMLQHSRASSGQKEPTDLAALAEEYLNLAYHGMRAKERDFNVHLKTDFEPGLPEVNMVPQDIGRVLLNIYNNAFQALNEKAKLTIEGYEPYISVHTRSLGGKVEIKVRDNGMGMSDKVKAKVFQPFFTTKPTGQGTGLGLSLSFDIIKAHQGAINVESREGEFSEFTIVLPV